MDTMRALVKEGPALGVRRVPRPRLLAADDVVVRVAIAGLCRTDVYVAEGKLPCREPVVLGHEFAGVVHEAGAGAGALSVGDRVTAAPLLPCRACARCRTGGSAQCTRRAMLGVDRHGAFAEFIALPASALYKLPDAVPLRAGAYTEPVAAALAVRSAGLSPGQRGVLYGNNRIAALTRAVLAADGITDVLVHDPARDPPLEEGAFAFAIETLATEASLRALVDALGVGGTLVLKSRPATAVPLDVRVAVRKELTLRAVNYGPFPDAIALLASGRLPLDALLGAEHALEDFAPVFAAASTGAGEAAKQFFAL